MLSKKTSAFKKKHELVKNYPNFLSKLVNNFYLSFSSHCSQSFWDFKTECSKLRFISSFVYSL